MANGSHPAPPGSHLNRKRAQHATLDLRVEPEKLITEIGEQVKF
ncbi:MAG: hypothetical protein ACE5HO_06385 [bacterium]